MSSKEYLYFPGCSVPYRENAYEVSSRAVAEKLGIVLKDRPFNCCGLNTESLDEFASFLYSARNIALAEEEGMDLITLCNGCYKTLKMANLQIKEDIKLREEINNRLASIGKKVEGTIEVIHFLDIIDKELKEEHIKEKIDLKVASHAGCHATRPSKYIDFKAQEKLDRIIEMAGGKSIDYLDKDKCCGAPLLIVSEELGMSMASNKLTNMENSGASAAITMCPFCQVSLDSLQNKMKEEMGQPHEIPALYITQFLGLSMGIPEDRLGLKENKTYKKLILK